MTLEVHGIRVGAGRQCILEDVSLRVDTDEFVGLLGPNGSGKSTLLKTICRVNRPQVGSVTIDGCDVHAMRPRDLALRLAVVAQETTVEFDFSVWEMVMLGRTPHKAAFEREHAVDRIAVGEALERVGVTHLGSRSFLTLSGGEKQRVLIARALAQEAAYIILDEPTNHLDMRYQLEVLDLLSGLGVTVLAALHDINLAAAYCDRLYLLDNGRVHAKGTVQEVITPDVIHQTFGVNAVVSTHPVTGRPHVMLSTTRRPALSQPIEHSRSTQ